MTVFNRLLTRERIDALEREGGVCIVSTHLGKGFEKDGKLNAETDQIFRYLAAKSGWFAPVSDILDHLLRGHKHPSLTYFQQLRLEFRFVIDKIMSSPKIGAARPSFSLRQAETKIRNGQPAASDRPSEW